MERDHLKGASGDAINVSQGGRTQSAEGYRSQHHRQPPRPRQDRLRHLYANRKDGIRLAALLYEEVRFYPPNPSERQSKGEKSPKIVTVGGNA
jgi:hypothetical protein